MIAIRPCTTVASGVKASTAPRGAQVGARLAVDDDPAGMTMARARESTSIEPISAQLSGMDMTDGLVSLDSNAWFEMSSDYQQEKSVPSWNSSPQPKPTNCISGITYYVHIFCAESRGDASGPSRISINIFYTRSKRVGGS